jgi:glycosyltransferase involved in cell wall biosynthesis
VKNPRIAIDATYSLGPDLSGVGIYSRELLNALALARPDVDWEWLYRPHRYLKSRGIPLPPHVTRGILFDAPLWRQQRLFHGLNQRLPRRRFARQIATFHDLFVMTADYSTPEFRARFTGQARHAAAEADHIIAVSHFTARQVTELLGVESSRVTVVPHGVRALSLPELPRQKMILHVGAIQKRKNLVRLVRAFDAAPNDWELVLAGSDGYGAKETHDAIARSPSRNRITVTGYLNEQELAACYARATLFAFPSLDEGFGMPVLEAMACGIPVLASSGSAVGEVAGNDALLVNPEDQEEITAGIEALTRDSDLRQRFIASGRIRAASYTWQNSAAQTLAIYERFIRPR